MGGREIGPLLRDYAAGVPAGHAIVEVGSWLGAGTVYLAEGAAESGAGLCCYDRWRANADQIRKGRAQGVSLEPDEDTLPRIKAALRGYPVCYHKGELTAATWHGTPIGLYVDDAAKTLRIWRKMMALFMPHFVPGTILVLMDYHYDEKRGPAYGMQKRFMAMNRARFECVLERLGDNCGAVFRYLG